MDIFLLVLRLALTAVLGVAAFGKLIDREGSEKALNDFGVPKALIPGFVFLLPVAEIVVAISLLFVQVSWFGAIGAAGLFLVFTTGMVYQYAKGNAPDCHCFGQIHSEVVGVTSILRNVALIAIAVVLIAAGSSNQGLDLVSKDQDIMQVVIGIAVIGLLAAVVYFLKKISEQQVQIMRRIELMELVSQEGGEVAREEITHPHEGLPIGGLFPDFELLDVNANTVSLASMTSVGTPTLFFFVSPTCNPCKALLPEIDQWRKELMGKVNFVFISNGKAQDNIDKFGNDPMRPILLQKQRELADGVKAQWTPTVILMDANGRVASHPTAGDTAIRSLISQLKDEDLERDYTYFARVHDHAHNKIGESVPDFSIQDIKGKVIDSDYFKGKQTLVTFWSTTCQFCSSMMDELKEWDKTKGKDAPDLVLFSEGDKETHEKFQLSSPVILEEGYKTAAGFGMFGTPSAVLVNEEGKIISETAVGAANIWSLVGKK
ncbi:MAG: redoxin domain-containing protein [Pyrinomonadaceae bacterium]